MPTPWSSTEVELIVADYFAMFAAELRNEPCNKAAHRTALLPLLNNRSTSALEWKHQNISAVLIQLQRPCIAGYKPRYNYQRLLAEEVENYLRLTPGLDALIGVDVERVAEVPTTENILNAMVSRPAPAAEKASDHTTTYHARPDRKVDYLARRRATLHSAALESSSSSTLSAQSCSVWARIVWRTTWNACPKQEVTVLASTCCRSAEMARSVLLR